MAKHQTFVLGPCTIEMHAGSPGEQFIGVNPQGPSDSANPPATKVVGKQTVLTTPYQKIVSPA